MAEEGTVTPEVTAEMKIAQEAFGTDLVPDEHGVYHLMLPVSKTMVRFKKPGMLGQRKIHSVMPVLDTTRMKAITEEEGTPDEIIDGMLRIAAVMCIEPRFSDDPEKEHMPRGMMSLDDLDMEDCRVLMKNCTGVFFGVTKGEQQERPTSPSPEKNS